MPALLSADRAADMGERLAKIKTFYETLSPDSLDQIGELYAPNARFKDPFQSVQGQGAIRGVFEHMFQLQATSRFIIVGITQSVTETVPVPDTVPVPESISGAQACLRWIYWLELRGKPVSIEGCSWLCFDAAGYIVDHRDYWDAAEELYEKIPVLSWLMQWLRRKIAPG
ncbi:MAG: nuclear transport factor 2 family protein [Betaproteobacteria bacterium]|nr:nuclear transport factor 2 family protein [Betaproteobacteria bacterium]